MTTETTHDDTGDSRSREKITAARLWNRTGVDGKRFLAGSMGALKVLVVQNRNKRDENDAEWLLMVCQNNDSGRGPRVPRDSRDE